MKASALRLADTRIVYDDENVIKRIGLILLATDLTSERDFARMLPRDAVDLYCSRIAYANPTTPDNLRKMQTKLSETAALLLPDEALDVVCYSCTAASVVIGDEEVEAAVALGKPGAAVVTPPSAVCRGLGALGAQRISMLTPYTKETSAPMARYFEAHGFEVQGLRCFGLEDDRVMARVTPQSIVEAAREAMSESADALFISCTALRAAEVAGEIERAIGKPVVTSNQASVWMALRRAGVVTAIEGYGHLLRCPLTAT
ncbi:ectoine utilization protein EutA [Pelagibius sp. Alg239-R121]|uniref:ectoine utilization protein EutA n=1 Tax=Pelagibius sp. Alg239-R121 TaxID=2993448 RepID=UPI0024A62E98|nr:ectoine utilization protein EutA [Pelagibius sp. Alg239-R121]